jgi:hypothetical protein
MADVPEHPPNEPDERIAESRRVADRVRGRVNDRLGRPVVGVRVVAVDCDLRREQELGEATTDPDGQYEISYGKAQSAERSTADLIVRVVDAKGATLVESATIFDAGRDETVLLIVDGPTAPSE